MSDDVSTDSQIQIEIITREYMPFDGIFLVTQATKDLPAHVCLFKDGKMIEMDIPYEDLIRMRNEAIQSIKDAMKP